MSNVNADVVARVQQLEQQGAGKSDGWSKVIGSNNPTGPKQSLQSTEVKQASNLLNSVYVDRSGVQHTVDQSGNPVNTNTPVESDNASQGDTGSYAAQLAITNPELTQKNAMTAYESGNGEQMRYAINETLVANFAQQMDTHNSNPQAVWNDVTAYAKANKTNNQRKVFNEVMQSGSGQERQQAINSLIQDFKNTL